MSHGRRFIQGDIIDRFLLVRQAIIGLTKSEQRVLDLASEGKSTKEIAEILGKNIRTIENYLGRIYNKFGVSNRQDLLQLRGRK